MASQEPVSGKIRVINLSDRGAPPIEEEIKEQDFMSLLEILKEAFSHEEGAEENFRNWKDLFMVGSNDPNMKLFAVRDEDGKFVAFGQTISADLFAQWRPDVHSGDELIKLQNSILIRSVCVSSSRRGEGIGKLLMQNIIDSLLTHEGFLAVTVWKGEYANGKTYQDVVRFQESFGFELCCDNLDWLGMTLDTRKGFAVSPKEDCAHIHGIGAVPEQGLNVKAPCETCDDGTENWVCLFCHKTFCSRYVKGHMREHSSAETHPVVASYSDLSVWCFQCDSYVKSPDLQSHLGALYQSKFGSEQ